MWSRVLMLTLLSLRKMKSPKFLACTQQMKSNERVTYVLEIAIVQELHEKQNVAEELTLCMLHNFFNSL
jgi:hypothetical protein